MSEQRPKSIRGLARKAEKAGLHAIERLDIRLQHPKSSDQTDPLHAHAAGI